MNVWMLLSPFLCLVVGGLGLMLVDAFHGTAQRPSPDSQSPTQATNESSKGDLALPTSVTFFIAALLAVGLWSAGAESQSPALFGSYLAMDTTTLLFTVVICSGAALCALLAGGYLREHGLERGEYYPLLVFCTLGAVALSAATDLVMVFLGLETMSLGVYALVAFRRSNPRSAEGALKYFLLGSFATALFLFGCALLYTATGHTDLQGIGEAIRNQNSDIRLTLSAAALLIIGLAFKVSAVPFHMWTPDAYEGAATPVTTFMAVTVKAAAFAALLRILMVAFGDPFSTNIATGWPPVITGLAAVTMVFGNIAAIVQSSVKRMLAYSSIAHAGYILVGVVASVQAKEAGLSSILFYIMAYTASNILTFGALILIGSKGKEVVSYLDLAGAGRRYPLVAVPFVLGVLSLMGFPPTAGFFAKYAVFNAAISASPDMVWLVIVAVLSSAVGAYYYLRVIVFLFMKTPEAGAPVAIPMKSGYVVSALVISGYFVVKMGVVPGPYLDWALAAANFK